ncbi:MAG: hypothetical protein HXX81_01440 [Campylobacterales bacterium]|nr:hypothetical protein [Campylobacterales bacterium]
MIKIYSVIVLYIISFGVVKNVLILSKLELVLFIYGSKEPIYGEVRHFLVYFYDFFNPNLNNKMV